MTRREVFERLAAVEQALDRGEGIGGTGFWQVVGAVKRSPELVDEFADRIAEIDQRAFAAWARLVLPAPVGTSLALAGTGIGLAGVALARTTKSPWSWLSFGGGTAALLGATHGLAHLVVGNAVGIRFTSWYMASVRRPQPGVKIDYASYLRTPPMRRAWMHASGALVGKAIPFLLLPVARAAELPRWTIWALAGFGSVQVATDAAWSTKSSDWKRFARERRYAIGDD